MSGPATILVVDDELQNRKLLQTLLQPEGYLTRAVDNGEAALASIALQPPDLILLDIMMPGMDGYEVARTLKADPATSSIPIIMVTALVDRAARLAGLEAGVEEFLTKPVDRSELWLRVRNLLRLKTLGDFLKNHGLILERQVQERTIELQRFRSAMDATADAIMMISRTSLRLVEVNATACRMLGYTREELLELSPAHFVSLDIMQLADVYDEIISGRVTAELTEMRFQRKDGSYFQAEIGRHALQAGADWIIVDLVRDITERKQVQAARDRLAAILESTPDFVSISDAAEKIVYFNRAARVALGVGLNEELTEATIANFVSDPANDPLLIEGVPTAVRKGSWSGETILLSRSGREIPVSQVILSHKDADGNVEYLSTIMRDISQLKKAERSFKDLLEAAPDAMVLGTDTGEIALVNSQAVRLFGWSREELLGESIEMLVPERFRGTHANSPGGFFSHPQALAGSVVQQLTVLRKDGSEFPAEISQSPLETSEGTAVMSAIRDITERVAAQRRIVRLSRVHAVLSGINTLIVRVQDREQLFSDACRVAVSKGRFKMAWVGLVDPGAKRLTMAASDGGDQEYLDSIRLGLNQDESTEFGLTGRAVLGGKPVVVQDMKLDPRVLPQWGVQERGYHSLAVLPLSVSDEVVGVLALYADEVNFFDAEEMDLLTELAGDISFAIDNLRKQDRLDYQAYYDALTGLANRTLFLERMSLHMRAAATGAQKLAIFLIDLERFKNINESLGRPSGDALLMKVSKWLVHAAGDANLVARTGADHFALLLPVVTDESGVAKLVEKRVAAFMEHPFPLADAVLRLAAKVGVALYPADGTDAETLFRHAEAALKKAKVRGDRFLFYNQNMTATVAGQLTLENQLRQALDKEEFVLHYQPKVNLQTGKVCGAEALIRWNDPATGLVPPGRFIPSLEETGLISDVGRWALRKAMEDYLRWRAAGLPAVRIAVNVSPLQLRNRGFMDDLQRVLSIAPLASAGLEIEITESVIMEDVRHSVEILRAMGAMGITTAIDDFGTGFSSLSHLAKLPVDTLKIDRSFVTEMTLGPDGLALVSTIITLARSLELKVVAEGVETREQSRLLRLLHCDEMQGFLFSKPVPALEFEARFLSPVAEQLLDRPAPRAASGELR